MSSKFATLAQKLDLLFELIKQPNGQRVTYEYLERKVGIKSSTISRLRRGQNLDPLFTNIIAIANAFGVRVSFFATDMTLEEAREYLEDPENVRFIDDLRVRQQQIKNSGRNRKLAELALRASYLDDAGIEALANMAEYVLNASGIDVPDKEVEQLRSGTI